MRRSAFSRLVAFAAVAATALGLAEEPATEPPASQEVAPHRYTLTECLALTDRNHPNIWIARARLAYVHAQLDEAKWAPFFNWSTDAQYTPLFPSIQGTAVYSPSNRSELLTGTLSNGVNPFMRFNIEGVVPLYTFGQITSAKKAAEANVRVNEWDLEKVRQQARWDVRRAYFGLMFARDARYLVGEVASRIEKAVREVETKIADGDPTVGDPDRLRLELYQEEVRARAADAPKGETFALAALRFLTGVQTQFDIPDEPLKRPDIPLGPVVRYLTAARLFRPEVNMARAGVMARRHLVNYQRAKLFPVLGVILGASFVTAPSAVMQNNPWVNDPLNGFGFRAAFGVKWNLDLLPQAARVAQAESQLEETRAQERLALGGLGVEVEQAHSTAVEAKAREEAWGRAESKAKEWIASTQSAIEVGSTEEKMLVEPLRAYVDARIKHLQAMMDYNNAMSMLALASGWDAAAPTGN